MRFKKQKRHRKAVRFYTACFGFREPFKILCDGTFVHHLIANGIAPADTALENILGAPVKIFTTRCVVAELKSLGSSYSDSVAAACSLMTARCDHEKRKSAVACITEVIGEKNTEHFFVATQDADLRKKFQQVPGVPAIYALRNALFLESPSAFQQEFAKAAEEERSHMSELERKILKLKKKRVANDEARDSSDEDHSLETLNPRTNAKINRMDKLDKAQFKRKRAKGPNPLSCKKKKKQGDATSEKVTNQARSQEGDGDNSARNKKRKRSRKSKTSTESITQ